MAERRELTEDLEDGFLGGRGFIEMEVWNEG
jgi:hypothetical protein